MDTTQLLAKCNLEVTPNVIEMITGLDQTSIKVGQLMAKTQMLKDLSNPTIVKIEYTEGLDGECYLLVDDKTRDKLVAAMMGMSSLDGVDIGMDIIESALCELMNQLSGSIICKVSELADSTFDISPPTIISLDLFLNQQHDMLVNIFHNPEYNISLKLINNIKY